MNTNNNNPYRANASGAQGAGQSGAGAHARNGRGYARAAARHQAANGQVPQSAAGATANGQVPQSAVGAAEAGGASRQAQANVGRRAAAQPGQTGQASASQQPVNRAASQARQNAYQQRGVSQGAAQQRTSRQGSVAQQGVPQQGAAHQRVAQPGATQQGRAVPQGARPQNAYRQAGVQNAYAQNSQARPQAGATQNLGQAGVFGGFNQAGTAQTRGRAASAQGASQQNVAGQAGATFGYNKASARKFNAQNAARNNANAAANYGVNAKKKKSKRFWTVVMIVAAIVMVIALGILAFIGYGYWHGTKVYDEISQTAGPVKETESLASMTVDWDALRAQNEDIVGWIYMPGTSIDYPIVQGDDDNEYLQKDFTGDSSGIVHKGTIFLSTINSSDFSDQNNFIYGHNMNDETMFAHVLVMANQSDFDAARTFYIYTPTKNYRCQTFALDIVKNTDTQILQTSFADASSMASYITARIQASSVTAPTDVDISSIKKMFTLITCGDDYATTRAVLFGASVEEAVPDNATSSTSTTSATTATTDTAAAA